MKFCHNFDLINSTESALHYKSDDINARLDFVSDSCVRVAVYKDSAGLLPTFNINPNNDLSRCGRDRLSTDAFKLSAPVMADDKITMKNGVEITVDMDNFLLTFSKDGEVLLADRAPLAYNLDGEFGADLCHYVYREEDERIFGLGDKGGDINKAGRSFAIETTDSMGYNAKTADPLYKHIPFYICDNSVGSYGIFYDTSDTSYIDLGREHNNYYKPYKFFRTKDNCIVYYVFFGTMLQIMKQFNSLCGKQAFPPKWSFDYCASTMAYTDAPKSIEKMMAFIDKLEELGLSCQGFYLSSGYTSIGDQRYVFNWNYDKFPNPKKFITDFAKKGINIIPNIKPAFLSNHPMYEMIEKNGWFVKNSDGTPFVTQFWDGLGSYLDFTNDEAFDFWKNQVKKQLLDFGIICTWNDNNEFDIRDEEAVANGFGTPVLASKIRPTLTYLMDLSSYEAQVEQYPNLRPFLSTRSGGIGARRLAQTWSGDNRSAFCDLRYCHNIGLTMSMSGLYFYGHDLGGFSGDMPSRELLLRWLQHGLFEPRFTIHSWNADGSATMPWSYDDIVDSVKDIFAQRRELMPYLYNCAYNAVENEEPINSPLFLYYDDEAVSVENNSFLLGRDILASCIFDEGEDSTSVYLPKGDDWYLDGVLYKGGSTVDLTIPAGAKMPYFVRSGSVVATNTAPYGFNREEEITLTVYPVQNGSFKAKYFDDDGVSYGYKNGECTMLNMTINCTDNEVQLRCRNDGRIDKAVNFKLVDGDERQLVLKFE